MSEDTKIKKVIERVTKLLALAGNNPNEAEAAAAAAQAQKLLEQYNLDMAMFAEDNSDDSTKVDGENWDVVYGDPWRSAIVRDVASLYFCEFYHSTWYDNKAREKIHERYKKKYAEWERKYQAGEAQWRDKPSYPVGAGERKRYVIVGRPHNRAVALHMMKYLIDTTLRLAAEFSKDPRNLSVMKYDEDGFATGEYEVLTERAVRISFERGCGERLAQRIRMLEIEQRARQRAEQKKSTNPDNLPVLYDMFERENRAHMETLGLVSMRSRGSSLTGAAAAGAAAAEGVGLSVQVGSGGGSSGPLAITHSKGGS